MGIVTDLLIIGAGPEGLHAVFRAGLLGLKCHVVDSLDKIGGRAATVYPNRQLFGIPGILVQTAQEHVDVLIKQAGVFNPVYHMQERVNTIGQYGDSLEVITNSGKMFHPRTIILATGSGCFIHRLPKTEGALAAIERGTLHSNIIDINRFIGKDVVVLGGDQYALDRTIELAKVAKTVKLVHKNKIFQATDETINQLTNMHNDPESNVSVVTKCELLNIGVNSIKGFCINDKKLIETTYDDILCFYGMHKTNKPALSWGIDMHSNKIAVDNNTYSTSRKGIFAIGSCCSYARKIDTFVSGYHEAAIAVQEAYRVCTGDMPEIKHTYDNTTLKRNFGIK